MKVNKTHWGSLSIKLLNFIYRKQIIKKNFFFLTEVGASLVTQLVKNLLAIQETLVQFLVWEDPLEKR